MNNIGLILEGGGMRGVYTAGVLDYFMDNELWISHCYGVSAGAINITNYLSKQRGRSFRTTANYINDKRYCSIRNLLVTGDLFGANFLYNRIPNELDCFSYKAFKQNESKMTAVITNVDSGEAVYKSITDLRKEMQWLRASCSLPFLSKIVEIDDNHYLDGGISDSIPLAKAMSEGHTKNIVILTQHEGYLKQPEVLTTWIAHLNYHKYPKLRVALKQRHLVYNQQLKLVEQQNRLGNVLVIRPKLPVTLGRTEKNIKKLATLYRQGYEDAQERKNEIMMFLEMNCK